MKRSHPERWRFGGVLRRMRYEGEPAKLRTWAGGVEEAKDGDTIVLLQTPHGPTVAAVEHVEGAAA